MRCCPPPQKPGRPGSNGGPVELVASVNGTPFRVLAESISRERVFGDASIRISGRGRNAVLAAPYAPVMNFQQPQARTARQLMDDVLTLNGIPLGWNIDWGLTDWNVPAGVFTSRGRGWKPWSPLPVRPGLPDPAPVRPEHPRAPPVSGPRRGTGTPSRQTSCCPSMRWPRESLRWVEKPGYNRVFVSGQDVGVLGQVTGWDCRDVLAPMVVDALITEAAAAPAWHRGSGRYRATDRGEPAPAGAGRDRDHRAGCVRRVPGRQRDEVGIVRSTQVEAGCRRSGRPWGAEPCITSTSSSANSSPIRHCRRARWWASAPAS